MFLFELKKCSAFQANGKRKEEDHYTHIKEAK